MLMAFLSGWKKLLLALSHPTRVRCSSLGLWHVSSVADATCCQLSDVAVKIQQLGCCCVTPPTGSLGKRFADIIEAYYFVAWWPESFTSVVSAEQLYMTSLHDLKTKRKKKTKQTEEVISNFLEGNHKTPNFSLDNPVLYQSHYTANVQWQIKGWNKRLHYKTASELYLTNVYFLDI